MNENSDIGLDTLAETVGFEAGFDHAKDSANGGYRDDKLGFAVYRIHNVSVIARPRGMDLGQRQLFKSVCGAGSHSSCRTGFRLNDDRFPFHNGILRMYDLTLAIPAFNDERAAVAAYVPARQLNEIERADLDLRRYTVFKSENELEIVVAFGRSDRMKVRVHRNRCTPQS